MTFPFPVGTKVVANGFRNSQDIDERHCYGTNPLMEVWEQELTVLTVTGIRSNGGRQVQGPSGAIALYHPSELRLATDEEIAAAPAHTLKRGSIVKLKDGKVGFLAHPTPDKHGDYHAMLLSTTRSAFFKVDEIEAILGSIEEGGGFNPAASQPQGAVAGRGV